MNSEYLSNARFAIFCYENNNVRYSVYSDRRRNSHYIQQRQQQHVSIITVSSSVDLHTISIDIKVRHL